MGRFMAMPLCGALRSSPRDGRLSTGTLYALLERAIVDGLVTAGEPYVERAQAA